MLLTETTSPSRKRLRSTYSPSAKNTKESLPNLSEEEDLEQKATQQPQPTSTPTLDLHPYSQCLSTLYSPSHEAKIWAVASKHLHAATPPKFFPEYTKPGGEEYVYRELDFWTSGFFPGSLWLLLERRRRFFWVGVGKGKERKEGGGEEMGRMVMEGELEYASTLWTLNLHQNAHLRTTHDLGFMIMPWARLAYDLNHDMRALETIKTAADSLFSRYDGKMKCIRSWDACVTKKYNFWDKSVDYMVIIDNMMNLNLLFYAASQTNNIEMYNAAVAHAHTTTRTHIRPDGSTTHLIVLDPHTGDVKARLTNQGYSHTSCWARGQAWAIAGFAETYSWTHDIAFLDTARRCADYFLGRMPESGVVPWDFDALEIEGAPQPPDVSAAVIAAYGMLVIHEGVTRLQQSSGYLQAALNIVRTVCETHLNPKAEYKTSTFSIETVEKGTVMEERFHVDGGEGETILKGATINNYEFAPRRWADHGLVYADYYFLLIGNKLLEMGISTPFL